MSGCTCVDYLLTHTQPPYVNGAEKVHTTFCFHRPNLCARVSCFAPLSSSRNPVLVSILWLVTALADAMYLLLQSVWVCGCEFNLILDDCRSNCSSTVSEFHDTRSMHIAHTSHTHHTHRTHTHKQEWPHLQLYGIRLCIYEQLMYRSQWCADLWPSIVVCTTLPDFTV